MTCLQWAIGVVSEFVSSKAYGDITLSIQNGKIVNIKTVKSEKPPVDNKMKKA